MPTTRTAITTKAMRSPRDMTGMIIYLPPPNGLAAVSEGGSYGQSGTPARVPRQGSQHVLELREQDPRRADRAPVRLPGGARPRRHRLRVSDASARRGVRRGLARARDRERAVLEADPRRRRSPPGWRGDRARRQGSQRDGHGDHHRWRRMRDPDRDLAGRLAGAGKPRPVPGGRRASPDRPRAPHGDLPAADARALIRAGRRARNVHSFVKAAPRPAGPQPRDSLQRAPRRPTRWT